MLRILLCNLLVWSAAGVTTRDQQQIEQREQQLASNWDRAFNGNANIHERTSPLTQVVGLLSEISKTLMKDENEDAAAHDKLACWSRDNVKTKEAAVKGGTKSIGDLGTAILGYTASSASLTAKVKDLNSEVAENTDALAKATAMRTNENTAFVADEKASIANIASLGSAVTALEKHNGVALPQLGGVLSFLQSPWGLETQNERDMDKFDAEAGYGEAMESANDFFSKPENSFLQPAAPKMQQSSQKLAAVDVSNNGWSVLDQDTLRNAIHAANSFMQKKGRGAFTAPASAEIFGMLSQMKEDMEKDLADSRTVEQKRATDFAALELAKKTEIEEGSKSSTAKAAELAQVDVDNAKAKEDRTEAKVILGTDEKFLAKVQKSWDEANTNFNERLKTRSQELAAVTEGIEILSAAAAPAPAPAPSGFLQLSSEKSHNFFSDRRKMAARLLRGTVKRTHSPMSQHLALLANAVEIDSFKKVKKSIDGMVKTLGVQQADEVKVHDYCNKELQSNGLATDTAKNDKGTLTAAIGQEESALKTVTEEIGTLTGDITKATTDLQTATDNRKTANIKFQKDIADQTETESALKKALNRLATFYDAQFLVQVRATEHRLSVDNADRVEEDPPAQKEYAANAGASGVLSTIETLILDARKIIVEAKKNEAAQQQAYEELVGDSNASIKALSKSVMSKTDTKVETSQDLTQNKLDLGTNTKELERLAAYDKDMHDECDYLIKNFALRQQARTEEMESLNQAKSILSGASADR